MTREGPVTGSIHTDLGAIAMMLADPQGDPYIRIKCVIEPQEDGWRVSIIRHEADGEEEEPVVTADHIHLERAIALVSRRIRDIYAGDGPGQREVGAYQSTSSD